MGFHLCEFCDNKKHGKNRFSASSSGDVSLVFTNGRKWVMPDMILHYIGDHNWLPPREFVEDIMSGVIASSDRSQTRSVLPVKACKEQKVGYLSGPFAAGVVPYSFLKRLEELMERASNTGYRVQTKGLSTYRRGRR
jgi:hypothetical protein